MSRSFFALGLVLAAGLACSRTEKLGATAVAQPPGASPAVAPAPTPAKPAAPKPEALTPAAERERAERFFNETASRHGGYLAMAANLGSQRSSIRRLDLGLGVFQSDQRFPPEPDLGGLERLLRSLATKLPAPVLALELKPAARPRPKRPAEVPDGTPIELDPDDVRGTVAITMTLGGAPSDELVRKVASESIPLLRLVVWRKAERIDHGGAPALRLSGEAYWFYPDVAVSKVKHRPPTFDEERAKLGLPAVPADPAAKGHVEKTRVLFEEIAAKRNDYEQMLALIRETVLKRARFAFVRERRAMQDANLSELKLSLP